MKAKRNKEEFMLPRKEIYSFISGMFGQGFISGFMSLFLFLYYNSIGIKPMAVGIILGIARVWDGMNDPIIGAIIDRRKPGKNGKFRPLIINTAIPIGIITILLFFIPKSDNIYFQCAWILIFYLGWDILYTIHDISKWSLATSISLLVNERSRIVSYSKIMLEIGVALPHMIMLLIDEGNMKKLSELTGLNFTFENVIKFSAVLFGIAGSMIMGLSYVAKERMKTVNTTQPLLMDIKILFKNKPLMLLLLSTLLGSLVFNIGSDYYFFETTNAGFIIFGNKITGANALTLYGILSSIPSIIFAPFVNKIELKIGNKNIIILNFITACICNTIAFFVGHQGFNFYIVMILMIISSIPRVWQTIATVEIVTDSIDYLEWKTGRRTEGTTFALNSLTSKIGMGISTMMAGLTLKILEFNPYKVNGVIIASEPFKKWVWPLFILKPVFSGVLSIIPILFIDYTGKKKEKIQNELNERRTILANKATPAAFENPDI